MAVAGFLHKEQFLYFFGILGVDFVNDGEATANIDADCYWRRDSHRELTMSCGVAAGGAVGSSGK